MAKKPITQPTYSTNNVESLPAVVVGDETYIQNVFDKVGVDTKTYLEALTAELNGAEGAEKIGLLNPNLAALSVSDGIEEVRQVAVQAQAGSIVDNSIDNTKLVADIKVGSLAELYTANKLKVTDAINETYSKTEDLQQSLDATDSSLNATVANLNVLRQAIATTGSSIAYAVTTPSTFDLSVTGNRLMVIPNVNNTGSCTLTTSGNAVKNIRKADDSGNYVVLEANDIKKGVPTEFVWSVANDFFILRPSGGSNIKSIQKISIDMTTSTSDITINSVDQSKTLILIERESSSDDASVMWVMPQWINSTTIRLTRGYTGTGADTRVRVKVIEFKNATVQHGNTTSGGNVSEVNITISTIDQSKTFSYVFAKCTTQSSNSQSGNWSSELTTTTNLRLRNNLYTGVVVGTLACEQFWQVVSFK